MQMPYVAVMFGLVLYTASHIAEIVRVPPLAFVDATAESANVHVALRRAPLALSVLHALLHAAAVGGTVREAVGLRSRRHESGAACKKKWPMRAHVDRSRDVSEAR